jgi:hypothetical protein
MLLSSSSLQSPESPADFMDALTFEERFLNRAQGRPVATPRRPGVVMHHYAHDSWCARWRGGQCNCEPTIKKTFYPAGRAS